MQHRIGLIETMPTLIPQRQREFAVEVVHTLREAGHEAYWAGGCVRDQLLGRTPYDYDVATAAHPPEIRRLFGRRRTLAIGAAFGVITVLGPEGAGQIEVATFREDAAYSDGRHPDRVTFSTAEADAQRRDFTINGMFFDPLENKILDFVGGRADLERRLVRAIGQPRQRFDEDKLRMLRAVRFAAIFDFALEAATLKAIREMASQVTIVSPERIAAEMRILLVHPSRARSVELLDQTGLLPVLLPEVAAAVQQGSPSSNTVKADPWRRLLDMLAALETPSFALALATLLHGVDRPEAAREVGRRWRLSHKEVEHAAWLLEHRHVPAQARELPWSQLQPLLARSDAADLIRLAEAQARVGLTDPAAVEHCRTLLHLPEEELNPPPLLTGADLIDLQVPRGPVYARLLHQVRVAQLDHQINSRHEALELVQRLLRETETP
jgi:poly(A) polymerase